ncbi:transcription factor bHLH125 [Raphanus sativus]|uniref:Transcription factor bHLH125 n=1 Tax=Raphanus sativus TaxID=3726 RepID=A0A9W3CFY0_RAPSA|nr:transcription factor bHLH125 [Raphanus sativus]
MDFVTSLFMPDLTDEDGLPFTDSFLSPLISYQNHDVCNPIADKNGVSNKKRSVCDTYGESEANKGDDDRESKKMKHRDIERQRRLEVSSLFKSLRSLLPLQYIQGKRSSADHVFQAVNYIKDLENKIKELNEKKNRLNKSILGTVTAHPTTEECTSSVSSSLSTSSRRCSCADDKHITVIIMPCFHGMEIIISCCLERNQFRLSSVLQILAQEERLSVVSCLSTRLQQRFIHTIVSQVGNGTEINISELKDKILNMSAIKEY